MPTRSQEKDLNVQMDIMIEMNLDMGILSRSGYTFIDVLSDVGGIQGLLISAISIIIGFFNYNHFDTFVASRLFTVKDQDDSHKVIKPTHFCNVAQYVRDLLPA